MSLLLAVGLSWALVALGPLLTRALGRRAGYACAAALLAVAGVVTTAWVTGGETRVDVPWMPALDVGLRLRLDGLAFLFALVVLVVGALVMVYSAAYVRAARPTAFYVLMTAFAAAMLTLVLADDLVVLFVAWELTTVCSYLLILRSGPDAGPPATRTFLVTAAGGLALLGAVVTVAVRTGTTDLTAALADPAWQQDPVFAGAVASLVAFAAMTKSAQFPFHAWLPDAMVAPAPVSAYLHAAAMVKAGIYLLLLFAPAASASAVWPAVLITVGLVTCVMGALFALQRTDLKELLAYSTVSQLGLLVAVIGVGTPTAMLAAVVHVVAHALFKSAAFMSVGLIEKRTGTRDLRELRGLARSMPWDAALLAIAVISMAGVAPTLGFVSKETVLEAFFSAPDAGPLGLLAAGAVVVGAVLTAAYSARMVVGTLPGPRRDVADPRPTAPMSVAVGAAALGGLGAGLAVASVGTLTAPAVAVAAGVDVDEVGYLSLWHGVNPALLASLLAVAAGLTIVLWRRGPVDALLVGRRLLPVAGTEVVQRAHDGVIRLGRRVGDLTRSDAPARHLAVPVVLLGAGGVLAGTLWRGLPEGSAPGPFDIGLLVVVVAGIVATVRARSRLTAVVAVGVVGFGVVLWFFVLGASDVALTQLLVEILTVVVLVFVLRRMSKRLPRVRRRRSVATAAAAVGAGVAATLGTLVFTGHRPASEVGDFFLREAQELTGGTNVVNTILVDFRALDTLGELVVLAVAAAAIAALLDARRAVDGPQVPEPRTVVADPARNAVFLQALDRLLVPVMLGASLYALLRGHTAPGGGFIAALIGACALVLAYLAAPTDDVPRVERPYLAIAGAGVVVAVVTGLLGFVDGAFLRPLHAYVLGVHLTSALVFDVGVYLAVLGVILAAVNRLGLSPAGDDRRDADPRDQRADLDREEVRVP